MLSFLAWNASMASNTQCTPDRLVPQVVTEFWRAVITISEGDFHDWDNVSLIPRTEWSYAGAHAPTSHLN